MLKLEPSSELRFRGNLVEDLTYLCNVNFLLAMSLSKHWFNFNRAIKPAMKLGFLIGYLRRSSLSEPFFFQVLLQKL